MTFQCFACRFVVNCCTSQPNRKAGSSTCMRRHHLPPGMHSGAQRAAAAVAVELRMLALSILPAICCIYILYRIVKARKTIAASLNRAAAGPLSAQTARSPAAGPASRRMVCLKNKLRHQAVSHPERGQRQVLFFGPPAPSHPDVTNRKGLGFLLLSLGRCGLEACTARRRRRRRCTGVRRRRLVALASGAPGMEQPAAAAMMNLSSSR